MEILQPYIEQIVQALIGLLVVFVIGIVTLLRTKVNAWLVARTTAAQRDALNRLAQEGMALAEATYKSMDGPAKLNKAIAYVSARIAWSNIDEDQIRAAVEKAVLDYNARVKGQGATVYTEKVGGSE